MTLTSLPTKCTPYFYTCAYCNGTYTAVAGYQILNPWSLFGYHAYLLTTHDSLHTPSPPLAVATNACSYRDTMKTCPSCEREWPDDTKFCPHDGTVLRADVEAGDLVGNLIAERYHVLEKLGEGGMGAVYLAEHVKMGLKVAIKVMSQRMANDVDAIARFHREAKNAARIKHPNVCSVIDFGETPDGLIYLAMDYIEGESLTSLLQREGALSPRRAAGILSQCCDALQAAHDLDIVHRDLKPDNIMIEKARDGSDFVKIVDFGIAKAMMAEDGQTVTKTGYIVGTPEYMSPEQVSGEVLDGRSDNYSLALVLFRMLTGSLPFRADTPQESLTSRLVTDPLKLKQAAPGFEFPAQLQQLMDRALARSRDSRFSSAVEFGKSVDAVLSEMPDAVPRVDVDAPTHLLESGAGAQQPTPETPAPARQLEGTKSKRVPAIAILTSVVVVVAGGIGMTMMMGGGAETADESRPTAEGQTPESETAAAEADTAPTQTEQMQTAAETEVAEQTQPARSAQDQALDVIEGLIAEGRVRTALERLDVMREEDITNDRVNDLIERAVRTEIDELVSRADFPTAISQLTTHITARPYLEHLEPDLKHLYLAQLEAAIEEEGIPVGELSQISSAYPRDAELLYQAYLAMAEAGWLAHALVGFKEVLRIDESYRSREPILAHTRAMLREGWISNINNSAREIFGGFFVEEFRSELIQNLTGEHDNLRLNSFQILRQYSREEFTELDLFEFHRLNIVRIANYRNEGQAFQWAIDYFMRLNDEDRIRSAITALETVLTNDSMQAATYLLQECRETIDRLRSAIVPVDVTSRGESPAVPSRNGYEFRFDWMDETLEGAEDYAANVSIRLEIDGIVVADQTHLGSVTALTRPRDCTRLGTRWFDVATQQPRQCTHEVLWRYRHPPMAPGEHEWRLSSSYEDGDNGRDSFEEEFRGTIHTAGP